MRLNGHSLKEFIGLREFVTYLVMVTVYLLAMYAENVTPVYMMPSASLCPVLGLLFGPYASAGILTANILLSIPLGNTPAEIAMDSLALFLSSYLPYRLWYGLLMDKDDRPPALDSVGNTVKFIFVMGVASAVYMVNYAMMSTMSAGVYVADMNTVATFVNVMAFSILIGMAMTLAMRYFGISYYTPMYGGTPDNIRRDVSPELYYIALIVGMAIPFVLLPICEGTISITVVCIIGYTLMMLFLLKPIEHARTNEKYVKIMGIKINKFNGSLIERMIAILLIFGLIICMATIIAANLGMFVDIFNLGNDLVTFYMSVGLLGFFLPGITFLWYIERNVTEPIGTMADASNNFISDEYGESSTEFERRCNNFLNYDTEVGDLARSLVKMTGDIESYIGDIKSLNSQQETYRIELNVAKNIQESFIPDDFPEMDGKGITIGGSMDAARYVGGDFYDFFMIDNDHIGLTIGDVSGKGVPAALFMAVSRSLIESHSHPGLSPGEIMAKVNINLCRNNDENMFVTSWLGILELSTGKLRYSCAGHNPPILVRRGEEPEMMKIPPSLVLGAREGVKYNTYDLEMSPGDRILLYTDGVTEANDNFRGFYGQDRLMKKMEELADLEPLDEVSSIRKDISEFTNNAEQFDDITMLLFRYDGTSR